MEDKKICAKCGEQLEDGALYCTHCGKKVSVNKNDNNNLVKIIGIVIGCVLIVLSVVTIFMLNDSKETVVMSPDELCKIIKDDAKLSQYMEKNIETTGYIIRGDDNTNDSIKLDADNLAITSSAENFFNDNFVLFKPDSSKSVENVGSFSEVQLNGSLEKEGSDIYLKTEKITVEDKKTISEGKSLVENEISKFKEKSEDNIEESNVNTIKDGDTVTVDDLLANPSIYAGKNLKVKGMFPQALIQSSDGRDIVAINNYTLDKYVEIKGGSPNFGGCEGMVIGNVTLSEGIPVINASSFESLDSNYGAASSSVSNSNYNKPFDVSDLGEYKVNYNMAIRSDASTSGEKVGSLKAGSIVTIIDFVDSRYSNQGLWGKIGSGEWVCIMDTESEYLTKAN